MSTDSSAESALTPAGVYLRERYAQPDAERDPGDPMRQSKTGYVPCAREHQPGRLCMLPDSHFPPETEDSQR